jgi:hypothetical protein
MSAKRINCGEASPEGDAFVADAVREGLRGIAQAITPPDAGPFLGADGTRVESLTEGAIFVGKMLGSVAEAINNLAEAVREAR